MATGMGSFMTSFGCWANALTVKPRQSKMGKIILRIIVRFLLNEKLSHIVLRVQKYEKGRLVLKRP
jgi:hypothetical protein